MYHPLKIKHFVAEKENQINRLLSVLIANFILSVNVFGSFPKQDVKLASKESFCSSLSLLVNGGWGPWSSWSDCPPACERKGLTRMPQCDSPPPSSDGGFSGLPCPGLDIEEMPCLGSLPNPRKMLMLSF